MTYAKINKTDLNDQDKQVKKSKLRDKSNKEKAR